MYYYTNSFIVTCTFMCVNVKRRCHKWTLKNINLQFECSLFALNVMVILPNPYSSSNLAFCMFLLISTDQVFSLSNVTFLYNLDVSDVECHMHWCFFSHVLSFYKKWILHRGQVLSQTFSDGCVCVCVCVDGPDGGAVIAILNCVVKFWNWNTVQSHLLQLHNIHTVNA